MRGSALCLSPRSFSSGVLILGQVKAPLKDRYKVWLEDLLDASSDEEGLSKDEVHTLPSPYKYMCICSEEGLF